MIENQRPEENAPRQEEPPELTRKEEKKLDELLDEIGRKRKQKKQGNSQQE